MLDWFIKSSIGEIASVIGVFISIIGFALTLFNVARSKSAAARAESAANEAQKSIRLFDTVADISKAISVIDEIKTLNRAGEWKVLLDRYAGLKKLLIDIRSANPTLRDEQTKDIQSTIQHLTNIEDMIERALEKNETSLGVAKLNKILSEQMEKLHEMLIELKINSDR